MDTHTRTECTRRWRKEKIPIRCSVTSVLFVLGRKKDESRVVGKPTKNCMSSEITCLPKRNGLGIEKGCEGYGLEWQLQLTYTHALANRTTHWHTHTHTLALTFHMCAPTIPWASCKSWESWLRLWYIRRRHFDLPEYAAKHDKLRWMSGMQLSLYSYLSIYLSIYLFVYISVRAAQCESSYALRTWHIPGKVHLPVGCLSFSRSWPRIF